MSVEAERCGTATVPSGEEGPAGPLDLHKELRLLAGEPQLAFQRATLERLAVAVEHGEDLAAWSGGGLVAAYAGEGALAPRAEGAAVWARRLGSATAVLVYAPLVLTWSGLGLAMYAYHEARQDRSVQLQGTFLEMWQQGFAGHLPELVRFDALVWYTITLLVLLVAVTLAWRSLQHRADEHDRKLLRRLAHTLARVEAEAVAAAHTEPRRFTEELQGAAAELRALLGLSDRAGELSQKLLGQAVAATAEAASATRTVDASAAALREAVASAAAASREAAGAAGHLTRGADGFGKAVQASTATLTTGMVAAAEEAAQRIVDAVTTASGHLTETATAASDRFAEVVAGAVAGLDAQAGRQADEVRTVLAQGREALADAAHELRVSASGLERSVAVLPESLEAAAGSGADHVGLAYETAVAALSASLQAEVRQAGESLAAATAQVLSRQEAADQVAQERHLASEQRLLASAAESRTVLVTLLQRVEEHTERLAELERHEETVRERDRENHRLRADALREELELLDQAYERHERLLDAWADRRAPASGPPPAPAPGAQTMTESSPAPPPPAGRAAPVPGPRPTGAV
ncbi:hypothetical protein ABZ759_07935 [Streptomyces sp. NPDC047860]|uniref:hypothetical protein n=1 Tax=Streptomyces sp. NPDC047860 TaxID=3155743 RepID=UPI00340DA800